MDDTKFIVYKHTSPSGKVYIGVTCQNPYQRWKRGKGYTGNGYFMRAIDKYGWDNFQHEILCTNLTKSQAEFIEIRLIQLYESANREFGYNIDLGGKLGGHRSEETKRKISVTQKGENGYWYGKKFSDEVRKRISKGLKGHKGYWAGKHHTEEAKRNMSLAKKGKYCGKDNPMYGKHISEEHKQKISYAVSGAKHPLYGTHRLEETKKKLREKIPSRPVAQMDKETHKVISIYPSMKNASECTNISVGNIGSCCYGNSKSAGGYYWEFVEKR